MKKPEWICKKFDTLTVKELYDIMKLRSEVFVVEQHCIYLDADYKDLNAYHLFTYIDDSIAAYARLLPPNISYLQASIGRVLTELSQRKKGLGILLMQEAIKQTKQLYNTSAIKIGAQLYLKKFYEELGFSQTSNIYDEDGIPHIEMEIIK
ncbi:MAG: GNAT family N-acetyltransferase [Ferruginibacter sp.]|nr:GNAT family N-acetyltransferase [Ferruginibacter sp.]